MKVRPIPSAPQYVVSSTGVVLRLGSKKPLRQFFTKGYPATGLQIDGKQKIFHIHRLVMEAYGPPKPFPKAIIRHLDDNPLNNNISNLAWGDQYDNFLDRIRNSLINKEDLPTKLQLADIYEIQHMLEDKAKVSEIAKLYSVTPDYIYKIRRGDRWKPITKGEGYHSIPTNSTPVNDTPAPT